MVRAFRVLWLLAWLAGCGAPPTPDYTGSDITGADFGRSLTLTDHNGRAVSMATFRGKLVVIFFGYTHCPDVCPTTLSDLGVALKRMEPGLAADVQVLFVTVDPERDTPEVLSRYVPYFNPSFLGLYGSPAEIEAVAREFKVVYRRHAEPGSTDYLVDHSAGSYVFDRGGTLRLYRPYGHSAADMAHDLSLLARSG